MNITLLFAVCLSLSLLMSCSEQKGERHEPNKLALPVTWYAGYKMSEQLDQAFKIETIEDIRQQLDKKWYAEVSVYDPAFPDKMYSVSSCVSLFDIGVQQLYTQRERDNAAFMGIAAMCQATKDIANGKTSTQTFFNDLKFDKTLPNILPVQVALITSVSESASLYGDPAVKYWSQANKITRVVNESAHRATYKQDGSSQEIELVAKGDFNGDGVEDILLTSRDSVEGGSYSATRLFVLTKLSKDGGIVLLR